MNGRCQVPGQSRGEGSRPNRGVSWAAGALAASLLAGCMSPDRVTFLTDTTLGLNAEQVPTRLAIAYERTEGVIGPVLETGEMPSVYASIRAQGEGLDRKVRQMYATGEAAEIISGRAQGQGAAQSATGSADPSTVGRGKRLAFFGTSTITGASIGYTAATGSLPLMTSVVIGHRRREASVLPLTLNGSKLHYPATIASIDTGIKPAAFKPLAAEASSGDKGQSGNPTETDTTLQFFAAGSAAMELARNKEFRDRFIALAEESIEKVYADLDAQQRELATKILKCYSNLPSDRLVSVWDNARLVGLMKDEMFKSLSELAPQLQNTKTVPYETLRDANSKYVSVIAIPASLNAKSRPLLMEVHQRFVCEKAAA